MKRIVFLAILVGVTLLIYGGCAVQVQKSTTGEKPSAEVLVLKMQLVADTEEMKGYQAIIDAYNQTHPTVQINLERIQGSWSEYIQKTTAEIASGDVPDIGRLNPANFSSFHARGFLEDITDDLSDINKEAYDKNAFESGLIYGRYYGVPEGIGTMAIYYNKALFLQANIPLPPSDWSQAWTWSQFEQAAEKITTGDGKAKVYGAFFDLNPEAVSPILWSNGGGEVDVNDYNKVTMGSPQTRQSLQWLNSLFRKGLIPSPDATQSVSSDVMFKNGKIGLYFGGSWMMPIFAQIKDFDWGVTPMFRATSNDHPVTVKFVNDWVVFKGSKHVKEAVDALKFFIGERASNIMVDHNIVGIPILKSVSQQRHKDIFNPLTETDKEVWLHSVEYSRPPRISKQYPDVLTELTKQYKRMGLGQLSSDQMADGLVNSLQQIINQP